MAIARTCRHAFTLVELLVVIAIASIVFKDARARTNILGTRPVVEADSTKG